MIKWDELRWILELIGIGLWCVYAYATVILCEEFICFVEVFDHVYLISSNYLENVESGENDYKYD